MLRVLVAEDSPTVRALLVSVLGSDPDIQVVAEARDGGEAVTLTRQLRPDLVTMDVLMPRVDGLEATCQIMIEQPTPIVVVTGAAEGIGGARAMQALRAGALTLIAKSSGPTSPGFEDWCAHFLGTIKAMAQVKLVRRRGQTSASSGRMHAVQLPAVRVIAIGASTGGPAALHRILGDLPADLPAPVLVVQHISSGFVDDLAAWLNTTSLLRVQVAVHGARLVPGRVYIAPDGAHLGVADRATLLVTEAERVQGFRPSATFLFESVARVFGPAGLGVILTGMGSDGAEGLVALRRAGGRVLAQDEESSIVYGMPRAAVEAGAVEATVSLTAMADRIYGIVTDDRPGRSDQ